MTLKTQSWSRDFRDLREDESSMSYKYIIQCNTRKEQVHILSRYRLDHCQILTDCGDNYEYEYIYLNHGPSPCLDSARNHDAYAKPLAI